MSVAGYPCMLIRCVCIAGELEWIKIGIGIFIADLSVTGNLLEAIEQVKTLMGETGDLNSQIKVVLSIVLESRFRECMCTLYCFISLAILRKYWTFLR
jgi:hypothetical protein